MRNTKTNPAKTYNRYFLALLFLILGGGLIAILSRAGKEYSLALDDADSDIIPDENYIHDHGRNLRAKTHKPTHHPTPKPTHKQKAPTTNPTDDDVPAIKKNVLWIMGDDLGAGMPPYVTADHPLFPSSILPGWQYILETFTFFNAYTRFTSCGPSRASMLTGRSPDTLGIWTFQRIISQVSGNIVTLLGYFTQRGYITETVGKVFHAEPSLKNAQNNGPYMQWEYDTGQTNQPHAATEQDISNCGNKFYCTVAKDVGDTASIEAAEAFFKARAADPNKTPWFLAIGLHRPHTDISIPAAFLKLLKNYLPDGFIPTIPNTQDWLHSLAHRSGNDVAKMQVQFGADWAKILHGPITTVDDLFQPAYVATVMTMIKYYLAGTRYTVDNMAEIIALAEKYGFKNNTVNILTADHGYTIGGPGNMLGKNSLWDAAAQVLLAIRDAGQTVGFLNQGIASTLDLYKTVVHLVFGLNAAENFSDDLGPLEGNTLVPGLSDPSYNANPLGVITQYPRCQPRGSVQEYDCMTNVNANTCTLPPLLWMGYTLRTVENQINYWWPMDYATTGCEVPSWPNMPAATAAAAKNWPNWTQIDPNETGTNWDAAPQEPEFYYRVNNTRVGVNRAVSPSTTDIATMKELTARLVNAKGKRLTAG